MKFFNTTNNLLWNNPLLRRYRCSLFRPSQLWIYITIYICVILLLLFITYSANQIKNGEIIYDEFNNSVYYQLLAVQVLLLWVWSAFNSFSALKQEVVGRTYDFFRLLPLTALQKTFGILIGKNLVVFLLAGATFVLMLIFGFLGDISDFLQSQVVLLLICVSLCVGSTWLLSSAISPGNQKKPNIAGLIMLFIFLGPFCLQLLFLLFSRMSGISGVENYMAEFYTLQLPVLILISLICLYFGIWSILGITRKFTYEAEPLFSRKAAVLFTLGYELLVLGLLFQHLPDSTSSVYLFWLISSAPALLVPLGSIKSFDDYLESCGLLLRSSGSGGNTTASLFAHSNLTLALALFAIWLIYAVITSLMGRLAAPDFILNIAVLFSFWFVLMLLLELYVVYSPAYAKIGLLLGFITVVYLFLPLILSFTMQNPALRLYCLFGFVAYLLKPYWLSIDPAVRYFICIMNVLFCVGPALLISRRYSYILSLRKKM